jgi:hypothetical protein
MDRIPVNPVIKAKLKLGLTLYAPIESMKRPKKADEEKNDRG